MSVVLSFFMTTIILNCLILRRQCNDTLSIIIIIHILAIITYQVVICNEQLSRRGHCAEILHIAWNYDKKTCQRTIVRYDKKKTNKKNTLRKMNSRNNYMQLSSL